MMKMTTECCSHRGPGLLNVWGKILCPNDLNIFHEIDFFTFNETQITFRASLIWGWWDSWTNSSQIQIPKLQSATHLKKKDTL